MITAAWVEAGRLPLPLEQPRTPRKVRSRSAAVRSVSRVSVAGDSRHVRLAVASVRPRRAAERRAITRSTAPGPAAPRA